jgi:hypothetical protein
VVDGDEDFVEHYALVRLSSEHPRASLRPRPPGRADLVAESSGRVLPE